MKLYHDSGSIDWRQWDGATSQAFTTFTDYSNYGLRAQEHFHLKGRTELVVGFDHDRYGGSTTEQRSATSSVFPRLLLRNDGAYAMVARTFGASTEITPSVGVRYTDSADFGGEWGGQAGLVVRRSGTELHANVARSFNLPGVYTAVMYDQWGRGDGWKGLEAEKLVHAELGVARQVSTTTRLQLTAFQDHVTNALRFVPPPPPPPMFANLGEYTVRGVEAVLSMAASSTVAVYAAATYVDPNPRTVPNTPQWSLVSGLTWLPLDSSAPERRCRVGRLPGRPQSPVRGDPGVDRQLLPAQLQGGLWALRRIIAFDRGLRGLGRTSPGTDYEYRPGYPAPGRVLSGGLDVRF